MGGPGGQGGGRRREEESHKAEVIARPALGHLRQALVDPRLLVRVARPVGCVLQLVGQRSKVGRRAQRQAAEVHVHHLPLVAVGVHLRGVVVRGVEVTRNPSEARVEDGDAGIIALAGPPLAAEAGGHYGVDGVLEGPGRPVQGLLRGPEAPFKVPVGVLAHVGQLGIDPVHVLVYQVNDPELVQPADLVLDWVRGRGRRLAGPRQAADASVKVKEVEVRRVGQGAAAPSAAWHRGCGWRGVRGGVGVSGGVGDGAARGVGLGSAGGAGVAVGRGAAVAVGVAVGGGEATGAGVQPCIRRKGSRDDKYARGGLHAQAILSRKAPCLGKRGQRWSLWVRMNYGGKASVSYWSVVCKPGRSLFWPLASFRAECMRMRSLARCH